eukprot:scaffold1172_cov180-Ochromonas_danica.AAC.9
MWSNFSGVVGAAIQKVQKLQNEIESQLDEAVGKDLSSKTIGTAAAVAVAADLSQPTLLDSSSNQDNHTIPPLEDNPTEADVSEMSNPPLAESKQLPSLERPARRQQPKRMATTREKVISNDREKEKERSSSSPSSPSPPLPSLSPPGEVVAINSLKKEMEEKEAVWKASHLDQIAQLEHHHQNNLSKLRQAIDQSKEQLVQERQRSQEERQSLLQNYQQALKQQEEDYHQQLTHQKKVYEEEKEEAVRQVTMTLKEEMKRMEEVHAEALSSACSAAAASAIAPPPPPTAAAVVVVTDTTPLPSPLITENELEELKNSLSRLTLLTTSLQDQLENKENELKNVQEEMKTEMIRLTSLTTSLQEELKRKEDIMKDTSEELKIRNEELLKIREIVSERERALESSNIKLSETFRLLEEAQEEVQKLREQCQHQKQTHHHQSTTSHDEVDSLKKQVQGLQEELKEKNGRLAAFEAEGQQLAKKQSEMEKNIRKNRQEIKEKEQEIVKLKESKDQLVKAIEQTQDVLRKYEQDNANSSKSLQAMQAVSAATTEKIHRLESEIIAKHEELQSQRKALENAWNDINDLKKSIMDLKAERDDLKKQLGEGTSRVLETENTRRDIEQREAVLRATSKQLEETLKQQMLESNLREERLRIENQNLQKKWQEAIMGREQLANELSEVTKPFLRQIAALQDQLRIKSDQFLSIETSLNERILKAENSSEMFEHKKTLLEEQMNSLKAQLSTVQSQYQEATEKIHNYEIQLERFKKSEASFSEERKSLESKLAYEIAQTKSAAVALKELEIKHKLDLQEASDHQQLQQSQHNMEIARLKSEVSNLTEQLRIEKHNQKMNKSHKLHNRLTVQTEPLIMNHSDGTLGGVDEGLNKETTNLPTTLANGELSYVAAEKMMQRQRQRDEELSSLQMQISKLEMSRAALLEEVSFLSSRNAQLEEEMLELAQLQADLAEMTKQKDVLLVLLGEKEEELEASLTDMMEVKNMYQEHIRDLLEQLTPTNSSTAPGSAEKHHSPPKKWKD